MASNDRAVDHWNEAVMGFNRRELITINTRRRPVNHTLEPGFWRNDGRESEGLIEDRQSVIYFKGGGGDRTYSFNHARRDARDQLVEADIYINTTALEAHGPLLVETCEVLRFSETMGAFAHVDFTLDHLPHSVQAPIYSSGPPLHTDAAEPGILLPGGRSPNRPTHLLGCQLAARQVGSSALANCAGRAHDGILVECSELR